MPIHSQRTNEQVRADDEGPENMKKIAGSSLVDYHNQVCFCGTLQFFDLIQGRLMAKHLQQINAYEPTSIH